MSFFRLLFMAIATFFLAVIAYSSLVSISFIDPDLASSLGGWILGAGAVGVVVFGAGAVAAFIDRRP